MALTLIRGDVFAAGTDAILMTFDGLSPGHWGNHAHRFGVIWDELFEDVMKEEVWRRQTPYGEVLVFERPPLYDDCPFRWILLASTLFTQPTAQDQKRALMGRAWMKALRAADRVGARTVAATLPRGGWRLGAPDAFAVTARTYESFASSGGRADLLVHVLDPAEYDEVVRAQGGGG